MSTLGKKPAVSEHVVDTGEKTRSVRARAPLSPPALLALATPKAGKHAVAPASLDPRTTLDQQSVTHAASYRNNDDVLIGTAKPVAEAVEQPQKATLKSKEGPHRIRASLLRPDFFMPAVAGAIVYCNMVGVMVATPVSMNLVRVP